MSEVGVQGYGAPSIFFYGISIQSGVTEVRSKILTPLETTGGNSFSLEGFEKIHRIVLHKIYFLLLITLYETCFISKKYFLIIFGSQIYKIFIHKINIYVCLV